MKICLRWSWPRARREIGAQPERVAKGKKGFGEGDDEGLLGSKSGHSACQTLDRDSAIGLKQENGRRSGSKGAPSNHGATAAVGNVVCRMLRLIICKRITKRHGSPQQTRDTETFI